MWRYIEKNGFHVGCFRRWRTTSERWSASSAAGIVDVIDPIHCLCHLSTLFQKRLVIPLPYTWVKLLQIVPSVVCGNSCITYMNVHDYNDLACCWDTEIRWTLVGSPRADEKGSDCLKRGSQYWIKGHILEHSLGLTTIWMEINTSMSCK